MSLRILLLFVPAFLLSLSMSGQTSRCDADALYQQALQDTSFARSYFAFEAAMAEMSATGFRSNATHTLPVVVHILHDGDDVGTGSNISDAQVASAIQALNADFQGEFGGADVDVEFALAVRDPEGNPTNGIVRIDVPETIPSFATTGMVTSSSSDAASEMALKNLSHWPGEDYVNVWVLASLNGGLSPLGFAYLPPTSGTHDGIVVHHQVFGVGSEFDLVQNYDLNRTLTHEMGHYLGLLHTFNATFDCGAESNCTTQGDKVCDTPPTTGSIGCSAMECEDTQVENFMDYANDPCMALFTEGQRTRMRDALTLHRSSLLNSNALMPVSDVDLGLSSLTGLASSGCASTLTPSVMLQNLGALALTEAVIQFTLDGGPSNAIQWSGTLEAGEATAIDLPALSVGMGTHTLTVWSTTLGDGLGINDTLSSDFSVEAGSVLDFELQFDALPFGISWEIVHEDGWVLAGGDDYDNGNFSGALIEESTCAVNGCYTLTVADLFGNGMHYSPPGWYALTDADGQDLGSGSGNFGSSQSHSFCLEGGEVTPCPDTNANGVCDAEEGILVTLTEGCTDPSSCSYDAGAVLDDGSCAELDALGECGGNCPGDADGDGVCDNAEILGCTDETACNFDADATEENGECSHAEDGWDCEGNPLVVVLGCTDPLSCTYDASANTEDGSCQYLDVLGECGGTCLADEDGDGVCDNAEVLGCTDAGACNYDVEATEEDGNCEYASEGMDCDGNPLIVIPGCTDPQSCTYSSDANSDDGSCEYLDALGECGGDCPADEDGDGICDNAEVLGCTDEEACNFNASATEEDGTCEYAAEGLDCDGNPIVSSVADLSESTSALLVYPNPGISEDLHIAGLPSPGTYVVVASDIRGRVLQQKTASAVQGPQGWTVRPELSLPTGMVILSVIPAVDVQPLSAQRVWIH